MGFRSLEFQGLGLLGISGFRDFRDEFLQLVGLFGASTGLRVLAVLGAWLLGCPRVAKSLGVPGFRV